MDSRFDCAKVTRRVAAAMKRNPGRSINIRSGPTRSRAACSLRLSGVLLSGRKNVTRRIAQILSAADTTPGNTKLADLKSFPTNRPPIAGPSVKPMPIAAPTMPREAARFSGTLTSDA
jgi:hypothetical protein